MEENKNIIKDLVSVSTPFKVDDFIEAAKTSIKQGTSDPLAVYTVLKRMSKISEEIFKDNEIKDIVLNEADKYLSGSKKSFDLYSATICKMPTYTYYDFSGCNDPELETLYKIQKEVALRIKLKEDELKELIPKKENTQIGLGLVNDTKEIMVDLIPVFGYNEADNKGELITVKAPKKIQNIGLKFMKL
jgi:hypothetical protein